MYKSSITPKILFCSKDYSIASKRTRMNSCTSCCSKLCAVFQPKLLVKSLVLAKGSFPIWSVANNFCSWYKMQSFLSLLI